MTSCLHQWWRWRLESTEIRWSDWSKPSRTGRVRWMLRLNWTETLTSTRSCGSAQRRWENKHTTHEKKDSLLIIDWLFIDNWLDDWWVIDSVWVNGYWLIMFVLIDDEQWLTFWCVCLRRAHRLKVVTVSRPAVWLSSPSCSGERSSAFSETRWGNTATPVGCCRLLQLTHSNTCHILIGWAGVDSPEDLLSHRDWRSDWSSVPGHRERGQEGSQ